MFRLSGPVETVLILILLPTAVNTFTHTRLGPLTVEGRLVIKSDCYNLTTMTFTTARYVKTSPVFEEKEEIGLPSLREKQKGEIRS
jgi:hypothetical protein